MTATASSRTGHLNGAPIELAELVNSGQLEVYFRDGYDVEYTGTSSVSDETETTCDITVSLSSSIGIGAQVNSVRFVNSATDEEKTWYPSGTYYFRNLTAQVVIDILAIGDKVHLVNFNSDSGVQGGYTNCVGNVTGIEETSSTVRTYSMNWISGMWDSDGGSSSMVGPSGPDGGELVLDATNNTMEMTNGTVGGVVSTMSSVESSNYFIHNP